MDRRIIKESPINAFLEMSILKHEGVKAFELLFQNRSEADQFESMLPNRNDVAFYNKHKNSVELRLR